VAVRQQGRARAAMSANAALSILLEKFVFFNERFLLASAPPR
jgi:hypothetical protein